jgi:hypothetical protein
MKIQKIIFRIVIVLISQYLFVTTLNSAEIVEQTFNVNERSDFFMYTGGEYWFWDEFTIVASSGITWLRVIENNRIPPVWEKAFAVIYDGVPVVGLTTKCVIRPAPCEGCYWQGAPGLGLVALGNGAITIRFRKFGTEPPFPIQGEYLDQRDWGTFADQSGEIVANPNSAQPGDAINIRVTLPTRMRQHVSGITLQLPTGPDAPKNFVTLPFDADGVYNYTWTVPTDIPYFEKLNAPSQMQINFTATSNRQNASGQFYTLTAGSTFITIASTLYVTMSVQGTAVKLGSNNTWIPNRERVIGAGIHAGQEPFRIRWIVNGQEVNVPLEYRQPFGRARVLEDQNVLANAGTVTFEVTDANNNTATGTIYIGIKTGMDFEISVQGRVVKPGSTIEWKTTSQKRVSARQTVIGQLPYRTRWIIDGTEMIASTSRVAQFQYDDQETLEKARTITFEVTDANNVQKSYTINIGNPEEDKDTTSTPTVPVGPAPTPPPLTGNPDVEPNPTVDWNNKPWLDERVRQCVREYLQNIVLYIENENIRRENAGLPANRQRPLFTSIDDWGRLLNQYISTSGGVDGNWDNPTHFVWSEFNKPSAAIRYGRTVEYYCKYECNLLKPTPDDLKSAIDDLADDEENNKWDPQRIKDAQNNLNALLELARTLYNQFNANYNKFVDEINDQRSNPTQNELVAFCLASAQNQFNDHSVNKDTLDALGNFIIAQAALNEDIEISEIIRILSEVQVQADDMTRKLDKMKDLLAARGGDIDEIITTGQQLIAQGNVNPEFAQDGGVNVEFVGDGVDNFGDGLQDFVYGNIRRGNVLIIVLDAGNVADDIFEVFLSGERLGETPPGGRQNFDISLRPDSYTLTIKGSYTNPNSPPCTFGIQVYDRNNRILQETGELDVNEEKDFIITIH